MKKHIRKNMRKTRGITLIALVITIIVLLILAGVSLSMVLNQDGIFSRAEQATDKYGQAKAREILELVLDEFQMTKYEEGLSGQNYENRLDSKIAEVGLLIPKEDENSNYQLVIVEGHIFEIDRSVPKIVDYKGPADGVIVTAKITQNGDWQNPVATVTGTITKYGGGSVVGSSATATNGVTITGFPTTGGSYTISNITTDTVITITTTDSEGKTKTHPITVNLIRDTTPPTITEEKAIADNELNIKISAKVTDSESGVASFKYKITPTTGLSTSEGDLPQDGTSVTITSTSEATYTVTITAIDNAGKTATKEITGVKTRDGGVIKHIKTPTGLKEVNTKDIYGADVLGYNCTRTGVEWQIFYIDEEDDHRVYLIAKDYITFPTTTEMAKGSCSHAYYWISTVLDNYTGKIPNTRFTQKFLSDYANTSASAKNLQATNYMLDQTKWSEYASTNNKSEFVFGGPTLPLFKASYNDISRTADKLDIQKSTDGYEVKRGTGSFTTGEAGFGDTTTQKGLYFKGTNGDPAYGMWLASPSSYNTDCMMRVDSYGAVWYNGYGSGGSYIGFRPIVSLQSNVQFISNADGTVYTIAN